MDDITQVPDDELWSALAQCSERDRLDVLWELGRRSAERGDYGRAMTLLEEAEAVAVELPDPFLAAGSLHQQGVFAFSAGDPAQAAARYAAAADGFAALGATKDASFALWGRADALRVSGEYAASLEAATSARTLAEAEDVPLLAGDACYQQARSLYMLDRDSDALAACRAGRDHYRSAGAANKVRYIDDFAIEVCLYLGQLDEALELAQGCLVLAEASSDKKDDAYQRLRLAEVRQRRGESEVALRDAERAKALFKELDDLDGVARCTRQRGEALYDMGRGEDALQAYLEARVLFDATGWDYAALRCDTRRAMVLHGLGDYEAAARLNQRLVREFAAIEEVDDARWAAVRLLDNWLRKRDYPGCLQAAAQVRGLWPEDAGGDLTTYREYLGFRAAALHEAGQSEEAAAIADRVITATPAREASPSTALCYEIRGVARLEEDEDAGAQDLAHAIALHLANGDTGRARELSQHFLPSDSSTTAGKDTQVGR